ncbi:glycosyltransferase [Erwinia aphidicola]|uniref:glycosyltransferase n=1 Tax=Erwinia aphidicola TaxID=68334 RepID=UPI003CF92915
MKFGITVVWFNPTAEQVKEILKFKYKNDCAVCIVDNSQSRNNKFESDIVGVNGINYIHNKNLGGIAGGFNRGVNHLFNCQDIGFVFTMDQDSILDIDFFVNMTDFCISKDAKLSCPNFYDRNSKTYGSFVLLTPFSYQITNSGSTHFCISSGMCISREAWLSIGQFNEDLIIDHVDTEYALRAYVNNIEIKVNYDQCLNHAIGERTKHKFLGVTIKPNHHSYIRKYYIIRNGTFLSFIYFKHTKGYFKLNVFRIIHEYLAVMLYEKDKLRKLKFMSKGLLHAIRGRLGAIK